MGRKNWLFADTPRGARASAIVYSLIETAKANGLEPFAYLRYVLRHIGAAETVEQLEALLPWRVQPATPAVQRRSRQGMSSVDRACSRRFP